MIVLGIDPGQTTGVCALETAPPRDRIEVVMADQIPWDRRKSDLWALLSGTFRKGLPRPDRIVVEGFRLRPGRAMEQVGSTFPSVEIIGLIEGFQYALRLIGLIIYQEPSVIGRVKILDEHAGQFIGLPHASDAYKHARYYCITTGEEP